jgi:hypothetical protein
MKKLVLAAALAGITFAPVAAIAGRQDFRVVNHTGHVVMQLQVSSSANPNWGPDLLGEHVIQNNQAVNVSFDRSERDCMWDIKVTYDDDTTNDLRQQNLCELSELELTAE